MMDEEEWIVVDIPNGTNQSKKYSFNPKSGTTPHKTYKITRMFVRDLLSSVKQNDEFVFKNISFERVYICGTVEDKVDRNDKFFLTVNDNTGSLKCILTKADLTCNRLFQDTDEGPLVNENVDKAMLQAANLVGVCTRAIEKSIPSYEGLKLGDIVEILGRFTEYQENKYLMVDRISRKPQGEEFLYKHMKNMQCLHKAILQ